MLAVYSPAQINNCAVSPQKSKLPGNNTASGLIAFAKTLTLGELWCPSGLLQAVLEQNQTLYPLILLGFQALGFPVSPFVN